MKIWFINEGKCGEALYLYKRVYSYMKLNDWEVSEDTEAWDCLVMNTCNSSMRITRKNLDIIQKYSQKKIYIIGCGISFDVGLDLENVYIIPLGQESLLDNWFFTTRKIETVHSKDVENFFFDPLESRIWTVEVSRWALHSRNYCGIGNVKSKVSSKSIDDILREIRYGISTGAKDIVLSSDDLAGYGHDIWINIFDLFQAFSELPEDIDISCNYIDPKYILEHKTNFLKIVKEIGRIRSFLIPTYFHSKTLHSLDSGYTTQEVLEVVWELKKMEIYLHNHLIVFYPEESYDDFLQNISDSNIYDCITFNPYYKKIEWDVYENDFFNNKEENIRKLKLILRLVKKYPQKFQVEERIERLLK